MATEKDKKKAPQEGVSQARQSNSSSAQISKTDQSLKDAASDRRPDTPPEAPPAPQRILRPPHEGGSNVENTVISDGQQLQYERGLRGWTQEELAREIGVPVSVVQSWETDHSAPDFTTRRKLSRVLGNDFYLSSNVKTDGTLEVRIVQRLLTAHDFTTIFSVLTEFYTQFWLIQQGRFDDLTRFAQTQDSRFVEEANLIITGLSYNSPALITFLTAPGTITSAVTGAVTFAVALQKVVDAIAQARKKLKTTEAESEKEKLDLEKEKLKVKEMQRDFALETATKLFDVLYPDADQQTRTTVMSTMVPTLSQLLNGK